jgi:hypothetical protein
MATTIVPSNLTVTISESYTLNGVDYGNTMNKTYIDNGQVSQRIMTIAAEGDGGTWTDILALSTADGQGQVVKTEYKYFRITNLDDTHTLHFRVATDTNEFHSFEVTPSSSFLLMDAGVDYTTTSGAAITFKDIIAIAGQSSHATESLDVEFVMVTS